MQVGIFAKTFQRPSVEKVFDAVRAHDLSVAQFNMTCAGRSSMPKTISDAVARRIRSAAVERDVEIAAVSGTFNMIHPNEDRRAEGHRRLRTLAAACETMGTSVITLCTGTRDPDDKWRGHPDNETPTAWHDLCREMERALRIAEDHDVTLAFEPEVANVVSSAEKGRRLLDEMASDRLQVVFDPANLFVTASPEERRRLVEEGLDRLGEDLILAHAKDRGPEGAFCPAGHGVLDYDHYVEALRAARFEGPLVLHGLGEEDVTACVEFVRERLDASS